MKTLLFFIGSLDTLDALEELTADKLFVTPVWQSALQRMKRGNKFVSFSSALYSPSCVADAKALGYTVHIITCQTL